MSLIDRLIDIDGEPPQRNGLIYKYCPPVRVDILRKLQLRLTQPGAFNDPFEGYPYTRPSSDEELLAKVGRNPQLPEIWHLGLIRLHRDGLLDREWSLEEVRQEPVAAGRLLWAILDRLKEQRSIQIDRSQVGMLSLFDQMLGIASFSEINDDILMWGWYAQSHAGFVLGFDSAHEFFTSSKFGLWPIHYTDERPEMTWDRIWNIRFHLTKATLWRHEKEWRFIAPILVQLSPDKPRDEFGFPVILADLPASLLRCVVLGARVRDDFREQILQVLASEALSHVELLRASLDPRYFRVNIGPVKAL